MAKQLTDVLDCVFRQNYVATSCAKLHRPAGRLSGMAGTRVENADFLSHDACSVARPWGKHFSEIRPFGIGCILIGLRRLFHAPLVVLRCTLHGTPSQKSGPWDLSGFGWGQHPLGDPPGRGEGI